MEFEAFDEQTFRQYEMFVLYSLMIGERIYGLFPRDKGWRYSIKDDLRMHKRFLNSDAFKPHLQGQEWRMLPLIEEVLLEPDSKS